MYLKPCIHLKSENVNIENESATGENFLTSRHRNPSPPMKFEKFDLPPKPKFQLRKPPYPLPNIEGGEGGGRCTLRNLYPVGFKPEI